MRTGADSGVRLVVVPFEPAHYITAMNAQHAMGDVRQAATLYYERGPAYTALIGDEIAACGGVVTLWPGMGEAWAVVTARGRAQYRPLHRAVRQIFSSITRDCSYRRVQADVVAAFAAGRRWAEHLGFELESTMTEYGPHGEDFVRYRILPKKGQP